MPTHAPIDPPRRDLARRSRPVLLVLGALWGFTVGASPVRAESLTRSEAIEVAETFIQHRWTASAKHVRHGRDAAGIEIHTPDRPSGRGSPEEACWLPDAENLGVAYKWGGFDTPSTFDAGLRAGKAAGDVYTPEKRRRGGDAVSGEAVGIDCSGFISRCWKLPKKQSTESLSSVCRTLASPAELQPADIMNSAGGHVLLFVKWLDGAKTRALFYEAAPFSKTRASEREIAEMADYVPMRYRQIRD
ncbi:MAG: hypothetical protein QOE70_4602 [Chthoniobacter sp.]|jgi:hypothetical protein|nr:hypothetical protein [Chthoniobacter sp.]